MLNRPDKRLYQIINEILMASRKDPNAQMRVIWGSVLSVDTSDGRKMFERIGYLYDLVEQVESLFKGVDIPNKDFVLRPFAPIKQVLSHMNMHTTWKTFQNKINNSTLEQLNYCSIILDGKLSFPENEIDQSFLDELSDLVHQLIKDLHASDLDDNLKAIILASLIDIQDAINVFLLRGGTGFHDAYVKSVGKLRIYEKLFLENKEQTLVKRYFDVMAKIDNVSTVIINTAQIASPFILLADKIL